MRRVSGPSFLGLADEPTSSVTYLLEDELSESHWGRSLVLILVLAGIAAAGWHWRAPLRAYVEGRLAQHPSSNQNEQASSEQPGSASTSPSEIAPGTPGVSGGPSIEVDKPKTGAGDTTLPVPQNPPPASNPAANAASSSATNQTAPAAGTAPAAAPASQAQTPAESSSSSTTPPAAANQQANAGSDTNTASSETPKPKSTAKKAKPTPSQATASNTDSDQLEAEGERYLYGTGVPANCGRAQTTLQAAAGQGSSKADSVLGTMYATGHCVNRDMPLAYHWFAKALREDPGNTRLQSDLQVLWNQMTPDERQLAARVRD